MKYPELIESCKKAIENGNCGGCQVLEDYNFRGNPNCKFSRTPSAQESINQIKLNLRNTNREQSRRKCERRTKEDMKILAIDPRK